MGCKDQELKVVFNEDRSSSLTVKGDDASSAGLGLEASDGKWATKTDKTATEYTTNLKKDAGDFVYKDGKVYEVAKAIDGTTTQHDFDALGADGSLVATEYTTTDGNFKEVNIDKDAISKSITQVEDAVSKLRNMASVFGNNYSIVENREEFTENLINVLEEGADKLTLADMNEEPANMLALQTRQQLAINSLSLASQAAQSVLSLF